MATIGYNTLEYGTGTSVTDGMVPYKYRYLVPVPYYGNPEISFSKSC